MRARRSVPFVLLLLPLLLSRCGSKESQERHNAGTVDTFNIAKIADDFRLPSGAWDELLSLGEMGGKKNGHSGGGDGHSGAAPAGSPAGGLSTLNTFFTELTVELREKTPGILKASTIVVHFPKGGGELDFSHYVTEISGTFFLRIQSEALKEAEATSAVFLSDSRRRKIGEVVVGSGCNTYFKMSDGFFSVIKGTGLEVNTSQDRHVSLLSGHLLIAARSGAQTQVSQVRFYDSRRKDLSCGERDQNGPAEY